MNHLQRFKDSSVDLLNLRFRLVGMRFGMERRVKALRVYGCTLRFPARRGGYSGSIPHPGWITLPLGGLVRIEFGWAEEEDLA